MIYVKVTVEEWLKKYPTLKIGNSVCEQCHGPLKYDRPWFCSDYVGLATSKCPCGKGERVGVSCIPKTKDKYDEWLKILKG